MDPFSKKLFKELEQMQQQTGRMLRNMSIARMVPMDAGGWEPPVDIYEGENEIYVYVDIAGVERQNLQVTVDEQRLLIRGNRQLPAQKSIACIHQLEIELGDFQRTVVLPAMVDVENTTSSYADGILVVRLPKRVKKGKVNIEIQPGE